MAATDDYKEAIQAANDSYGTELEFALTSYKESVVLANQYLQDGTLSATEHAELIQTFNDAWRDTVPNPK